jgi:hypothetical protein
MSNLRLLRHPKHVEHTLSIIIRLPRLSSFVLAHLAVIIIVLKRRGTSERHARVCIFVPA